MGISPTDASIQTQGQDSAFKTQLHEKLSGAHGPHDEESDAKPPAWHELRKIRITIAVLATVAVVGSTFWWFGIHPFVTTDDARVAATLVRVMPDAVSGKVLKLNVTEGSRVKKGDVLIQLDDRMAATRVVKARAQADLNERNFRRIREIVSQNGLAQKELDLARANSETSQAELVQAQTDFDNATIKSPIDGVVIQKNTEEGNIVEPGQALLTVADTEHAWVAANIEETSVGAVKIGQPVRVVVDEGGELQGKVLEIRSSVAATFALIPSDSGAGNFTKVVQRVPIKIALDPHDTQSLRAGQSVEIKIRVR